MINNNINLEFEMIEDTGLIIVKTMSDLASLINTYKNDEDFNKIIYFKMVKGSPIY